MHNITMMHSRMRQTQLKREQYSRVRRNLLLGDFWQRYQEQVDCEQKRLQLPEMTTQEERDFNYDKNKESRQKTSYTSRQAAGRVVVRLIKQVWASSSEDNPALWNQPKSQVWNLLKEVKLTGALAKSLDPLLPALIPVSVTRLRLSESMLNVLSATIKKHKPSLLMWLKGFRDYHSVLLEESPLPKDLAFLKRLKTITYEREFETEMNKFTSDNAVKAALSLRKPD